MEAIKKIISPLLIKLLCNERRDMNWIDVALNSRDASAFDSAWTESYAVIAPRDLDPLLKTEIDEIREHVFKKIYETSGNADLAAYISDDFELISASVVKGITTLFVEKLIAEYILGKFPR